MTFGYRKLIRDAVVAALNASFNTNHVTISGEMGVDPISIDFSNGSDNFCQVRIDVTELELVSPLKLDRYGMALWTDPATEYGGRHVRGVQFEGEVIFHVLGIITPRDGAETNTEDIMDAFEAAVLYTLNAYTWPVNLIYARETRIDRSALMPLADGFRQTFDLAGKFKVVIP